MTAPQANPESIPARNPADPGATYERRCAEFEAQRAALEQRSRRNGNLNLLLFFAAAVVLLVALWRSEPIWYALFGVLAVGFIVARAMFNRTSASLRRYTLLRDLNRDGINRLARNWSALPLATPDTATQPEEGARPEAATAQEPGQAQAGSRLDAATAADLDLLGRAGLEHLLGTPHTPVGQATLRRWILQPAPPAGVEQRRAAVRELAPQIDFRDDVGVNGRLLGATQARYEQFVAWAEGEPFLRPRPWLIWVARLLPLLVLSLGLAAWNGYPVYPAFFAVLGIGLLLTLTVGSRVSELIDQVAAQEGVFAAYAALFDLLAHQTWQSPLLAAPQLAALQQRLSAGGHSAGEQTRRLERMMPFADIRRWVLFFPIEIATLWSFHLLWQLEGWQRDVGRSARDWLAALGEAEALIALATLHFDHPQWTFPEFAAEGAAAFCATNLAHPLLPPSAAVGNDVQVGPPGSFLLVTGSNMSGKSTLLRAIGVNTVLAQMGGPVCADSLRLPPLTITTSMRVQDSLEQGVSYFMAELRRLKAVLDCAQARPDDGATVLYLLDEILQGTNTAERQIAARRIIQHLVAAGAIGAVSTHDLTLAAAPELAASSVPVHFTEQFTRNASGPSMHFDYKLRPGIATSTNALKLMELVGLPHD